MNTRKKVMKEVNKDKEPLVFVFCGCSSFFKRPVIIKILPYDPTRKFPNKLIEARIFFKVMYSLLAAETWEFLVDTLMELESYNQNMY